MKSALQTTLLAAAASAVLLPSCATTRLQYDAVQLRNYWMEMADDQILDNVIRGKNGLSIVQYDYTKMLGETQTTIAATSSFGQTATNATSSSLTTGSSSSTTNGSTSTGTTNFNAAGNTTGSSRGIGGSVSNVVGGTLSAVAGVTSSIVRPFTFGVNPTINNKVDFQMDPVIDKNQVYEAYEAFLAWKQTQSPKMANGKPVMEDGKPVMVSHIDTIRDSSHDPKPSTNADDADSVLIGKHWHGTYYWVPKKYREEFFNLCLVANTKRTGKTGAQFSAMESMEPAVSESEKKSLPRALKSSAVSPQVPTSQESKAIEDLTTEIRRLPH